MFWERFQNLCAEKNEKPYPLCKKIGLSDAAAAKWKKGSIPNGDALLKLSDYFDVSVDYLLGRSEYKKKPLADERLKLFFLLDDDDKQDIYEQMEYKLSRDKYKQDALPVNEAM